MVSNRHLEPMNFTILLTLVNPLYRKYNAFSPISKYDPTPKSTQWLYLRAEKKKIYHQSVSTEKV